MPQVFQVLRCYKCLSFQVHQVKKSNKWECKLCGEKQSIKRHYGVGTGKECRLHVQKLNVLRGEKTEQDLNNGHSSDDFESSEETPKNSFNNKEKANKGSKWSNYVEKTATNSNSDAENETLFGKEVVLELPKKRKKPFKKNYTNRKTKYKKDESEDECCEDETACQALNPISKDTKNSDVINHNSQNQVKRFIPPTNNSKFKWAEYSKISDNADSIPNSDLLDYEKKESDVFCNTLSEDGFNSTSKMQTLVIRNVVCPNLEGNYRKPYCDSETLHTVIRPTSEQNDFLLENNKNLIKKPVVNTLKQNSKWAEFVDNTESEMEEAESIDNFEATPSEQPNIKLCNMFSLCDDSDLDSVLDI